MNDPQPAFDQAEEVIAGVQRGVLRLREQTGGLESVERLPGVRAAQGGQLAAVLELE